MQSQFRKHAFPGPCLGAEQPDHDLQVLDKDLDCLVFE